MLYLVFVLLSAVVCHFSVRIATLDNISELVSFCNPNENKKMKLFLLILSLVRSECPTALTWQKTGDSGILKKDRPSMFSTTMGLRVLGSLSMIRSC